MTANLDVTAVFASAAHTFHALVARIGPADWDGPGLGEWDMRALVGHTSRSLITVSGYLQVPAETEDVTSAAGYYAAIRDVAAGIGTADIVERGRQAGRDLGADPAAAIEGLVAQALADVRAAGDPLITVIGGLGIRLSNYLPTRVFELAVHSRDIGRALGIDVELPGDVLDSATVLAARIALLIERGAPLLDALTGRLPLDPGFSVV